MYLLNLARILEEGGLTVKEEVGLSKVTGQLKSWQTFGRAGDSDYTWGAPNHVMVHHTASETTTENDISYMNHVSSVRPICNLYLARNGDVHVLAGGPTNTNGAGVDTWGGGTPANDMNRNAIGIEMGNNGVGEPYPVAQTNALIQTVAALMKAYTIPLGQVRAHFEWAPERKIDPAGQSPYATSSFKWDMDEFRADVYRYIMNQEGEGEEIKMDDVILADPEDYYRAFDGRINAGVTEIEIGSGVLAASINLTAAEPAGPGHLSLDGGKTSLVNWTAVGQVNSNAVTVKTPGGKIRLFSLVPCRAIVDVLGVAT